MLYHFEFKIIRYFYSDPESCPLRSVQFLVMFGRFEVQFWVQMRSSDMFEVWFWRFWNILSCFLLGNNVCKQFLEMFVRFEVQFWAKMRCWNVFKVRSSKVWGVRSSVFWCSIHLYQWSSGSDHYLNNRTPTFAESDQSEWLRERYLFFFAIWIRHLCPHLNNNCNFGAKIGVYSKWKNRKTTP